MMNTQELRRFVNRSGRMAGRFVKAHYRRTVSCLLIFSFTLTMTGVPALVAQARLDEGGGWSQNPRTQAPIYQAVRPADNLMDTVEYTAPTVSTASFSWADFRMIDIQLSQSAQPAAAPAATVLPATNAETTSRLFCSVAGVTPQGPLSYSFFMQDRMDSLSLGTGLMGPQVSQVPGALVQSERTDALAGPVRQMAPELAPAGGAAQASAPQPWYANFSQGLAGMFQSVLGLFTLRPGDGLTAAQAGPLPSAQLPANLTVSQDFLKTVDLSGMEGTALQHATSAMSNLQWSFNPQPGTTTAGLLATARQEASLAVGATTVGTQEHAQANAVLGRVEIAIYQQSGATAAVKTEALSIATVAAGQTREPLLQMATAQLLVAAGGVENKAAAQGLAVQGVQNLGQITNAYDKASVAMQLAQIFTNTGGTSAPQYTQALNEVKSYVAANPNGNGMAFAVQVNAITGHETINVNTIVNQMQPAVAAIAADQGMRNSPVGFSQEVGTVGGTVTKTENGYTVTNYVAGQAVITNFTVQEGNWLVPDTVRAESVTVVDQQKGQTNQIYALVDNRMTLTQARMEVTVNVQNPQTGTPATFQTDVLVALQGGAPTASLVSYTDPTTHSPAIYSIVPGENGSWNGTQVAAATDTTSRYANAAQTFHFDQSLRAVANDGSAVQTYSIHTPDQARAVGLEPGFTGVAYKMTDGTLFAGANPEAIQAGNYTVVGENTLVSDGGATQVVGYTAHYEGDTLQNATLSDGRVLAFQDGSTSNFTVTQTSVDGQRTSVSTYQEGQLQSTDLSLKNLGVTMHYDAQGNLTPESRAELQQGGPGFTYLALDSGGFTLSSTSGGAVETFSTEGRRVLPPSGETGGSGQQQTIEFDVTETMTLNIAKFNDTAGTTVSVDNIVKQQVTVQVGEKGDVVRTTSESTILGEFTIQVREVQKPGDPAAAGGAEWTFLEAKGEMAALVERGYAKPEAAAQMLEQGGQVTGLDVPANFSDHGMYTVDGNGSFVTTAKVGDETITIAAGLNQVINKIEVVYAQGSLAALAAAGVPQGVLNAATAGESWLGDTRLSGAEFVSDDKVTVFMGTGEDGKFGYSLMGTTETSGGEVEIVAAWDQASGKMEVVKLDGALAALTALGVPSNALSEETLRTVDLGDRCLMNVDFTGQDGQITLYVGKDEVGAVQYSITGTVGDVEVVGTLNGPEGRVDVTTVKGSEAALLGLGVPAELLARAESGAAYVGGEQVEGMHYAEDGKLTVYTGKAEDGTTPTYSLSGYMDTVEGRVKVIAAYDADDQRLEVARLTGRSEAMIAAGVPAAVLEAAQEGKAMYGDAEISGIGFMRDGMASVFVGEDRATGEATFSLSGTILGSGGRSAEVVAMMIDGSVQLVKASGNGDLLMEKGIGTAEIRAVRDGDATKLGWVMTESEDYYGGYMEEGEVQYGENGDFTVLISVGAEGKAVASLQGYLDTPEGRISIMAGMVEDKMQVVSANGTEKALRAAYLGVQLLDDVNAGKGLTKALDDEHQTQDGVLLVREITYEKDGRFTLQFNADGDEMLVGEITAGGETLTIMAKHVRTGFLGLGSGDLDTSQWSGTAAAMEATGIGTSMLQAMEEGRLASTVQTSDGKTLAVVYGENGVYTMSDAPDGSRQVMGTVLDENGNKSNMTVLTGTQGFVAFMVNGEAVEQVDPTKGVLHITVQDGEVKVSNTHTGTERTFHRRDGYEITGYGQRILNGWSTSWTGVTDAWNKGVEYAEKFWAGIDSGAGFWEIAGHLGNVFLCSLSVVGNLVLTAINFVATPFAAAFSTAAAWFRQLPDRVEAGINRVLTFLGVQENPFVQSVVNVVMHAVSALAALNYTIYSFIGNNFVILVMVVAGIVTGGASFAAAFGQAAAAMAKVVLSVIGKTFIFASGAANLSSGLVTGLTNWVYNFWIRDFFDLAAAIKTFGKAVAGGIQRPQDYFLIADAVALVAGAALLAFFQFNEYKGWVKSAATRLQRVGNNLTTRALDFGTGFKNGGISGAFKAWFRGIEVKLEAPGAKSAVEILARTDMSTAQRRAILLELDGAKTADDVGAVMTKHGLAMEAGLDGLKLGTPDAEGLAAFVDLGFKITDTPTGRVLQLGDFRLSLDGGGVRLEGTGAVKADGSGGPVIAQGDGLKVMLTSEGGKIVLPDGRVIAMGENLKVSLTSEGGKFELNGTNNVKVSLTAEGARIELPGGTKLTLSGDTLRIDKPGTFQPVEMKLDTGLAGAVTEGLARLEGAVSQTRQALADAPSTLKVMKAGAQYAQAVERLGTVLMTLGNGQGAAKVFQAMLSSEGHRTAGGGEPFKISGSEAVKLLEVMTRMDSEVTRPAGSDNIGKTVSEMLTARGGEGVVKAAAVQLAQDAPTVSKLLATGGVTDGMAKSILEAVLSGPQGGERFIAELAQGKLGDAAIAKAMSVLAAEPTISKMLQAAVDIREGRADAKLGSLAVSDSLRGRPLEAMLNAAYQDAKVMQGLVDALGVVDAAGKTDGVAKQVADLAGRSPSFGTELGKVLGSNPTAMSKVLGQVTTAKQAGNLLRGIEGSETARNAFGEVMGKMLDTPSTARSLLVDALRAEALNNPGGLVKLLDALGGRSSELLDALKQGLPDDLRRESPSRLQDLGQSLKDLGLNATSVKVRDLFHSAIVERMDGDLPATRKTESQATGGNGGENASTETASPRSTTPRTPNAIQARIDAARARVSSVVGDAVHRIASVVPARIAALMMEAGRPRAEIGAERHADPVRDAQADGLKPKADPQGQRIQDQPGTREPQDAQQGMRTEKGTGLSARTPWHKAALSQLLRYVDPAEAGKLGGGSKSDASTAKSDDGKGTPEPQKDPNNPFQHRAASLLDAAMLPLTHPFQALETVLSVVSGQRLMAATVNRIMDGFMRSDGPSGASGSKASRTERALGLLTGGALVEGALRGAGNRLKARQAAQANEPGVRGRQIERMSADVKASDAKLEQLTQKLSSAEPSNAWQRWQQGRTVNQLVRQMELRGSLDARAQQMEGRLPEIAMAQNVMQQFDASRQSEGYKKLTEALPEGLRPDIAARTADLAKAGEALLAAGTKLEQGAAATRVLAAEKALNQSWENARQKMAGMKGPEAESLRGFAAEMAGTLRELGPNAQVAGSTLKQVESELRTTIEELSEVKAQIATETARVEGDRTATTPEITALRETVLSLERTVRNHTALQARVADLEARGLEAGQDLRQSLQRLETRHKGSLERLGTARAELNAKLEAASSPRTYSAALEALQARADRLEAQLEPVREAEASVAKLEMQKAEITRTLDRFGLGMEAAQTLLRDLGGTPAAKELQVIRSQIQAETTRLKNAGADQVQVRSDELDRLQQAEQGQLTKMADIQSRVAELAGRAMDAEGLTKLLTDAEKLGMDGDILMRMSSEHVLVAGGKLPELAARQAVTHHQNAETARARALDAQKAGDAETARAYTDQAYRESQLADTLLESLASKLLGDAKGTGLLSTDAALRTAAENSGSPVVRDMVRQDTQVRVVEKQPVLEAFREYLGRQMDSLSVERALTGFNAAQGRTRPKLTMKVEEMAQEGLRTMSGADVEAFKAFLSKQPEGTRLEDALKQFTMTDPGAQTAFREFSGRQPKGTRAEDAVQRFVDGKLDVMAREGLKNLASAEGWKAQAQELRTQSTLRQVEIERGQALDSGRISLAEKLTTQARNLRASLGGVVKDSVLPNTQRTLDMADSMASGLELANAIKLKPIMDLRDAEAALAKTTEGTPQYKKALGDLEAAKQRAGADSYEAALKAMGTDLTTAIATAWETHYKNVYTQAGQERIAMYHRSVERFQSVIDEAFRNFDKASPASIEKVYESFAAQRSRMIASNEIRSGSIEDATLISRYGEEAFKHLTGNPSLRVSQQLMLGEFFAGRNVGLKAGGGKTYPFILFACEGKFLSGDALRAEILVDDAPAIDKYLNAPETKTDLKQGDMARFFGMELVNGNAVYKDAQESGDFSKLIDALRSPDKVVIFDHTTRAHLRNAEVSNSALKDALRDTNLVGIDEVHMAATSQTSAIIGGNVSKPPVEQVRRIDRLMADLGFDLETYRRTGKAELAKEFEVRDYRNRAVPTGEALAQDAASTRSIIYITSDGVKLNTAAQKALQAYSASDISATLRTLYSTKGKAGELNSYAVGKDGLIYPVDQLGKIQFDQISNDIVGQIVAARMSDLDPFTSVRVNQTTMQTSLSAMYAGNTEARIVGASGTIAGIENLMQSKIGAGSTHLSTSLLDLEKMVVKDGILTSVDAADRVVADWIGRRNVLVFETNPVTQLELVGKYMEGMRGKGLADRMISVVSSDKVGYYLETGRGEAFVKTNNLEGSSIVHRGVEVSGQKLDFVEVTKQAIQTVVSKAGVGNQICIINEQGAVGKDFQTHLTLVVRDGQKLTADMFTQLLLRTGRPGSKAPNGVWDTARYIHVNEAEMRSTVETAAKRLGEINSLFNPEARSVTSDNFKTWLDILREVGPEKPPLALAELLKVNSEFRQMELVGDSTRFAVQDTFKDQIVINPFKQALSDARPHSAGWEIMDAAMKRVLDTTKSADADIDMRLESGQKPGDLNAQYVRNTFLGSVAQAKQAWRSVLWETLRSPKAWTSGTLPLAFRRLAELNQAGRAVETGKFSNTSLFRPSTWFGGSQALSALDVPKTFADAKNFVELFRVGDRLMSGVMSRDTGGAPAGALKYQTSRIVAAAKEQAPAAQDQKAFREAWTATRQQLQGHSNLTAAGAAELLHLYQFDDEQLELKRDAQNNPVLDLSAARIALAPTYRQAVRALQSEYLRPGAAAERTSPRFTLPGAQDRAQPENAGLRVLGAGRVGALLQSFAPVRVLIHNWQDRSIEAYRALSAYQEADRGASGIWQRVGTWMDENAGDVETLRAEPKPGQDWFQTVVTRALSHQWVQNNQAQVQALKQQFPQDWQQRVQQESGAQPWVERHPQQVEAMRESYQAFGSRWVDLGLARTHGADHRFYQRLAELPSGLRQAILIWRQPAQAAAQYQRLMGEVNEIQAQLTVQGQGTFTFRDRTFTPGQARDYARQLEGMAQDLQQRYGLDAKQLERRTALTEAVRSPLQQLSRIAIALQDRPGFRWVRENPALAASGAMAVAALAAGAVTGAALWPVALTGAVVLSVGWMRGARTDLGSVSLRQTSLAETDGARMTAPSTTLGRAMTAMPSHPLVEAWKAQVGDRHDLSFTVLQGLLNEREHIRLEAGAETRYYGHMYVLAAALTLLENGGVSIAEMFSSINIGGDVGTRSDIHVPASAAGYFSSHRYIEILMTRAADGLARKHPQLQLPVRSLSFLPMFQSELMKKNPERWVTEFVKHYILQGEDLRNALAALPKDSAQRQALQTAYDAVRSAFRGMEYGEADLTELGLAVRSMERDAGEQMVQASREIQTAQKLRDPGAEIMKNAFELRFGTQYTDYQRMVRVPLGLRLVEFLQNGGPLSRDPIGASRAASLKLAGLGLAGLAAGAGLVMLGAAAAVVAIPAGVGALLLLGGVMVMAQTPEIAWKLNPSAGVWSGLEQAKFSPAIRSELLGDEVFVRAVNGLTVPGAGRLVSEQNRSRAVNAALNYLLTVVGSDLPETAKLQRTREVMTVLQVLKFKVALTKAERYFFDGKPNIQLTPVSMPPSMLLTDTRFHRLIEQLGRQGITLRIEMIWQQPRPLKLKTSDSAA